MAELPDTYARRPAPRFGGTMQARPVVQPGEIAAGQGLQRLGAEVANVFTELQLQQDKFELESRTTQYRAEVLNLQKEMQTHRSADVAEDTKFYQRYTEQHDALRAKHLEKASNHRVSGALSQRLEVADINFKEGLISHITKERDVYNTQVYKSSAQVNIERMASNPYNDSEIAQAHDEIVAITTLYADSNGLPKEAKDAMIKENLSKGHIEVISARIDDGEYERAESYFWKNKDEIDGTKHNEVLKALEKTGQAARTQDLADTTYLEFQDDQKGGLAYIRENAKPEDRDEAIRRLKNRYAEDEKQQNEAYEQTGISVRNQYNVNRLENGMDPQAAFDAIPLTQKLAMKPSELMALEAKVASDALGTVVRTDPAAYFAVEETIRTLMKVDPDAAKAMDLSKFSHLISTADLKALNTLRNKDPQMLGTETQILKEGVLALGIEPAELTKDSSDGRKARAFQAWVRDNLSPDYDKKELQDVVNRGIIKVITDDGIFWDSEEYAYTAGTEFNVPGVPPERVDEYAAVLQGMGMRVDIDNIMKAHALVVAEMPVTIENMDALSGVDLSGGELPKYEKQSQDFPGRE